MGGGRRLVGFGKCLIALIAKGRGQGGEEIVKGFIWLRLEIGTMIWEETYPR